MHILDRRGNGMPRKAKQPEAITPLERNHSEKPSGIARNPLRGGLISRSSPKGGSYHNLCIKTEAYNSRN